MIALFSLDVSLAYRESMFRILFVSALSFCVGTDHANAEYSRDFVALGGLEAHGDLLLALDHVHGNGVLDVKKTLGTTACHLLLAHALAVHQDVEGRRPLVSRAASLVNRVPMEDGRTARDAP